MDCLKDGYGLEGLSLFYFHILRCARYGKIGRMIGRLVSHLGRMEMMKIYLGCYTDEAHPNGLKVLNLDEGSGALSVVAEYPVSNALYQALSADGGWLYSCTGEGLASFRTGESRLVASDSIPLGTCVCHVAAMPDSTRIVFADYLGGFAGSVETEDGRFGRTVTHRHSGSGPNLPRQNAAHCHQAIPTPDGKGYCVVDLGLDQIVEYPSGRVFGTSPKGAGPRHLIFHPGGRLAFLASELGNLVSSLSWSREDGFALIDTLPTLPESRLGDGSARRGGAEGGTSGLPADPVTKALAAAIRFTPDRRRVVVSNRGENSLAVFAFDEVTGKLTFSSRTLLSGDWPRDFIFVDDSLALVACERSGEVLVLRYDSSTGRFTQISAMAGFHRPVALTLSKTS